MSSPLNFPDFDPVMISIGSLDIRWYGMTYMLAILFAWGYANFIIKREPLGIKTTHTGDFIAWTVVGVILGGRLGFALFYHPDYFVQHPFEIVQVWKGGMSFHGGLVGVLGALYFYSRYHKINYMEFMDLLALTVPMGIAFVRVGNFINGEHWGRLTDVPWGMVFPHAGYGARHPSQLYEVVLQGLLIFLIINLANWKWNLRVKYRGFCAGLFAVLYGVARITTEFFRDPDGYFGFLTMGQAYSLPMIAIGLGFIWYSWTHKPTAFAGSHVRRSA